MTFQVIRVTNGYNRRGDAINIQESVVAQFDTLGFAIANKTVRFHRRILNDRFCESFEVRDTAGNRFCFPDVWREMLNPERFDEIWNADICDDPRFSACSHVYVENLH